MRVKKYFESNLVIKTKCDKKAKLENYFIKRDRK